MNTLQKTTKSSLLARIRQLQTYFEDGTIPRLAQHEVHPRLEHGGRENYLYFTLPVCINFQRNSPAMWAAALATYNDPETRYVFFPEKLQAENIEKVRSDLLRHKLALQPNKHTLIWTTIARTLHEFYDSDPRRVIAEANHDAGQLVQLLQGEHRSRFPYLSGRKLSNYWPYILAQYTDVGFAGLEHLSIIPDTHVIQSSVRLGLVPVGATPELVEQSWQSLLANSGIAPVHMHPVLWNWSRNNFQPEV